MKYTIWRTAAARQCPLLQWSLGLYNSRSFWSGQVLRLPFRNESMVVSYKSPAGVSRCRKLLPLAIYRAHLLYPCMVSQRIMLIHNLNI